jgi:uncharacterized protein (TIGR03118 family)
MNTTTKSAIVLAIFAASAAFGTSPALAQYLQVNMVGYKKGMGRYTDPNLNGWGLAFSPDGPFCVANTSTGVATFYDRSGRPLPLVVTIPSASGSGTGSPTGLVYNPTSEFVISKDGKSAPALFIFNTLDGTISGWNPTVDPDNAVIMVQTSGAAYTGLTLGQNSHGKNVLYVADFASAGGNQFDMFDGNFSSLGHFNDPAVPVEYPGVSHPFGVEYMDGKIYVTFATFSLGPWGGVVDIFDVDGNLLTPNHFAANAPGEGPLANPWAIVRTPDNFGKFSNALLIGNVEGPGLIHAFEPSTGALLGPLTHPNGDPIALPGLWDLVFGEDTRNTGKANQLWFTAGFNAPDPTGNGLFGMIFAAGPQGPSAVGNK